MPPEIAILTIIVFTLNIDITPKKSGLTKVFEHRTFILQSTTTYAPKVVTLRRRGIPKSSRADMPDACILCSFFYSNTLKVEQYFGK